MRRIIPYLSQSIPWIFLVLSLAPLVVWACLGFFTRYLADDYGTSAVLAKKGFWPMQVFWYQAWSGRYSFTFVASLAESIGVWVAQWLPALALCAWFLALFWALKQIFRMLSIPLGQTWIGVLTGGILFGVIKSIPDYTEVIFWQTGILTYQASNILFPFCLALFLRRFFPSGAKPKTAAWEYVASFVLAFIVGGFSETWIAVQLALLTIALLYFWFFYKGQNRSEILKILLAAYLASWCSLVVMAKAPGNRDRTNRIGLLSLQSLAASFMTSIQDIPVFLVQWFEGNTALALLLLLAGVVIGLLALRPTQREKITRELALGLALLGVGCAILGAGFFPAYAIWGDRPAARAIFVPMFIFVWAYLLFGFFLGRWLNFHLKPGVLRVCSQGLASLFLALAMVWVQARVAYSAAQLVPTLQTYARLWDERDAFLRQAKSQHKGDMVIPSLRHDPAMHDIQGTIWMIGELTETPGNWINQAAADYYGLKSITGK